MSSFVGHSLAAWTIHKSSGFFLNKAPTRLNRLLWLGWLIVVAVAPDLDHFIPALHSSVHEGLRITHSLLICQILPVLTTLFLWIWGQKAFGSLLPARALLIAGVKVSLVGFSQIILDLLVGVTPLPLLWPFSSQMFKLPFGVLPSAGKLQLSNYDLYYNLFIELGVLAPLSYCTCRLSVAKPLTWRARVIILFLMLVSARFMYLACRLSR